MHRSALKDKRVAIWGYGREGRAAYAYLRKALPELELCIFCSAQEAEQLNALNDELLRIETLASSDALAAFDVVIKSPGISKYAPEAVQARELGTQFIG